MVRGVNKNVVIVKNTGSDYFEEAIFVISKNTQGASYNDMAKKAEELALNCFINNFSHLKKKNKYKKYNAYLIGAAAAGAVFTIIAYFF